MYRALYTTALAAAITLAGGTSSQAAATSTAPPASTQLSLQSQAATATDLALDGQLQAADGLTMAAAAKTRKIRVQNWSQTAVGPWHLWTETHRGRFYYDGKHVWVKKRHGLAGFHECDINRAFGGTITNLKCYERKGPSSRAVDMIDKYKASATWRGSPIASTHQMIVHAMANGRIKTSSR
jgi:hypothetical protein